MVTVIGLVHCFRAVGWRTLLAAGFAFGIRRQLTHCGGADSSRYILGCDGPVAAAAVLLRYLLLCGGGAFTCADFFQVSLWPCCGCKKSYLWMYCVTWLTALFYTTWAAMGSCDSSVHARHPWAGWISKMGIALFTNVVLRSCCSQGRPPTQLMGTVAWGLYVLHISFFAKGADGYRYWCAPMYLRRWWAHVAGTC